MDNEEVILALREQVAMLQRWNAKLSEERNAAVEGGWEAIRALYRNRQASEIDRQRSHLQTAHARIHELERALNSARTATIVHEKRADETRDRYADLRKRLEKVEAAVQALQHFTTGRVVLEPADPTRRRADAEPADPDRALRLLREADKALELFKGLRVAGSSELDVASVFAVATELQGRIRELIV